MRSGLIEKKTVGAAKFQQPPAPTERQNLTNDAAEFEAQRFGTPLVV
jgi:hypothetical protein